MPIIIIILGFFMMGLSLFFYKNEKIYWGFLVPPHMKKLKKIKDPTMFWLWITTLLATSLILLGKEDTSSYSLSSCTAITKEI